MVEQEPTGEIALYRTEDGSPALQVRLEEETVWLTQQQIADLFGTTQQNVSFHLQNVYDEGELDELATHKDFLLVRQEGSRTVRRPVAHYNLDAILSVGYRVKSQVATQFRIWATDRLREYLVKGAAINEQRLKQLGQVVTILSRSSDSLVAGTADVLSTYIPSLELLRDYDAGHIATAPKTKPEWTLSVDEARHVVRELRGAFPNDDLLGNERGSGLDTIIGAIYQSFAGQDLYPTAEEKAANLLYLVVKDHPLSDGNKRTAAALFVTFLSKNGMLDDPQGTPRVSSNALAALTLLVSVSDPREKEVMISLIVKMISPE